MATMNRSMTEVICPPHAQCKAVCQRSCFDDDLFAYVALCCESCTEWCQVSHGQKVIALAILFICLLLLAKKKWVFFPTGRAMGTFVCAVVMIASGNLHSRSSVLETPGIIDLSTLATLFGLTIVVGYFEDFGFMEMSMKALRGGSGPRVLMLKVTLLTGLLSAFVTNDAAVIALTGPLLVELRKLRLPAEPFLACLATSANIGSALTLIGNPQNILIASFSKMPFFTFLAQSFLPVFGGLILNYFFLLAFYHRQLACQVSPADPEMAAEEIVISAFSQNHTGETFVTPWPLQKGTSCIKRRSAQLVAALLTVIGILLGFVLANSVTLIALAGAAALLLIEVYLRDGEGTRVLKHVDGPLLVMIASLCVVISGARLTGVPDALYQSMNHVIPGVDMSYSSIEDVGLAMVFITVLSNLVSNVPTVLLLAPAMQKSSNQLGWLCLAWISTVAGNLTLVGSIANLIVAEKSAEKGVEMTFWAHFKYAFWSTFIIIPFGCALLFYVVQPLFGIV